jgi:hypothetical protein
MLNVDPYLPAHSALQCSMYVTHQKPTVGKDREKVCTSDASCSRAGKEPLGPGSRAALKSFILGPTCCLTAWATSTARSKNTATCSKSSSVKPLSGRQVGTMTRWCAVASDHSQSPRGQRRSAHPYAAGSHRGDVPRDGVLVRSDVGYLQHSLHAGPVECVLGLLQVHEH